MMELARIEFRARWAERRPQRFLGRALNAWLYGEMARVDERAASALHQQAGIRPFSAALTEEAGEPQLVLTAGPQAADLLSSVADRIAGTRRILLDGQWLAIENVAQAKTETFRDLVRRHLLRARAPQPVALTFLTPTTFHSRGRTLPLPLPDLVFGSLLDRWHAFEGISLGEAADAVVRDCSAIRRHRIRSASVRMEGRFVAFVGEAEFTLVSPPPEYAGLLAALASFAEFSGVGQKTAMGFGCVRATLLPPRARRPDSARPAAHSPAPDDTEGNDGPPG